MKGQILKHKCSCAGRFAAKNKSKQERTNKLIKYVAEEPKKREHEDNKDLGT